MSQFLDKEAADPSSCFDEGGLSNESELEEDSLSSSTSSKSENDAVRQKKRSRRLNFSEVDLGDRETPPRKKTSSARSKHVTPV